MLNHRSIVTVFWSAFFFACCMLAVGFIWIAAGIVHACSRAFDRALVFGDRVMRLFISEELLP